MVLRFLRIEVDFTPAQVTGLFRIYISFFADIEDELGAGIIAVHFHFTVIIIVCTECTGLGCHTGEQRIPFGSVRIERFPDLAGDGVHHDFICRRISGGIWGECVGR